MSSAWTPQDPLEALAGAAGIAVEWVNARGEPRKVSPDTLRAVLGAMDLDAATPAQARESMDALRRTDDAPPALTVAMAGETLDLPPARSHRYVMHFENGTRAEGVAQDREGRLQVPVPDHPGYHTLEIDGRQYRLAVAPARCPTPAELLQQEAPRAWGMAAQIYSLRRADSTHPCAAGYGDFGALAEMVVQAARLGADAMAISPVHAMFGAEPDACSPYSPSSRLFLNVLYADPCAVFDVEQVRAAAAAVDASGSAAALERLPLVDWETAGSLRLALLRRLYDGFEHASPALRADYARFRQAGGDALQSHAIFEVLHARHGADWRQWPAELRNSRSTRTHGFGAAHEREVGFHVFAQWLARASLAHAQTAARGAGMRLGLIADLAVGTDPRGSHAWSRQADIIEGLSIGAPPDLFNPSGQEWGLAAFSPRALQTHGYGAFIELLRAVLADTGGMRVDHILGLARLWVVPAGAPPAAGAYLRYPLQDLLRLIALEAWRHQALIVGENLGTVPEGFNERLAQHGVLGTTVLWFQTEPLPPDAPAHAQPAFMPPSRWPDDALAMPATHDLPTVRGWWEGRDLDWRRRLFRDPSDTAARAIIRGRRASLWAGLRQAGLAPAGPPPDEAPIAAALSLVAATPAALMLAPLEDLAGLADQPNLPGTVSQHPNWRQRLPDVKNGLLDDPRLRARIDSIKKVRSRP